MNKSIYEEAIEKVQWFKSGLFVSNLDIEKVDFIQGVLKQAQKQEKLLKLYRTLVNEWDDLTYKEVLRIDNEIKELENEL